jgi:peptidoglycan hydrolase-like protein with peptidoglycan-binding domain
MCVEKTRAYVKNKKGILNAVVGWGRPVYAGEENIALLSKGESIIPAEAVTKKTKATIKKAVAFKTIKVGSKGESVKKVQKFLGLKSDGDFGPGTEKAVKAFQTANKLKADGVVDSITFKALKSK